MDGYFRLIVSSCREGLALLARNSRVSLDQLGHHTTHGLDTQCQRGYVEQYAAEDKKRREEVDAKNEAENLAYQAEKLVNENGDKLADADKTTINTKAAAVKEAISKNDVSMINAAKEDLQKSLYEISAKLYQQAAPQQGAQGAPDMGGAQQPDRNNGGDPNVYDADFTDVDGNN